MSTYWQNRVKLKEAMTMDLKQTIRVWSISGLNIQVEGLPKNVIYNQTLIMKSSADNDFVVAVEWTEKETKKSDVENVGIFCLPFDEDILRCTKVVARFSSLEELKDRFSQLFEKEGTLYALQ